MVLHTSLAYLTWISLFIPQDKNVDLETSSRSQKIRILFCIYSVCRVNESLIPSKYAFSTSVLKDTKRRLQLGSLRGCRVLRTLQELYFSPARALQTRLKVTIVFEKVSGEEEKTTQG